MSGTDYDSGRSGRSIWSLILLAALTLQLFQGCSKVSVVQIDPRLSAPCPAPELRGETWRDVGVLAVELRAALSECDQRMRAIRDTTNARNN